jgi:hypothetical protein
MLESGAWAGSWARSWGDLGWELGWELGWDFEPSVSCSRCRSAWCLCSSTVGRSASPGPLPTCLPSSSSGVHLWLDCLTFQVPG